MKRKLHQVTLVGIDGTGTESELMDRVLRWCMKDIEFHSVLHVSGGGVNASYDGITRMGVPKMTYNGYNRWSVRDLPNIIQSDYCLNVHTDGFILKPDLWEDGFLDYDYVGAPWFHGTQWWLPKTSPNNVGNSGFCLRSRKFLKWSTTFDDYDGTPHNKPHETYKYDDIFLCVHNYAKAINAGIKFPDEDTAARFSRESVCRKYPTIDNSFGFHGKFHVKRAMKLVNNFKGISNATNPH
jgi:hypothetical protein